MDGSRRFSKVYSKTESGAEALSAARGALAAPARQLLILVDGQRDMRELASLFGEEALERFLPQLESQGYVRDLSEPPDSQVGRIPDARSEPDEEPDEEPVEPISRPPQRYFAVPLAIGASLLTALAIVYWIFAREQNVAETPPIASVPLAPASAAADTGAATSTARLQEPEALPIARDPPRAPARAGAPVALATNPPPDSIINALAESKTAPAADAKPPPPAVTERPAAARTSVLDAEKLASASSAALAGAVGPSTGRSSSPPTSALSVAADSATANSAQARPTPGPVLHERSQVLPTLSKKAQRSGIYAGKALVRLHVNSAGAVARVELVSATPPQVYDEEIEHALEQWTFDPPGNSATMTVELEFRQQGAPSPAAVSNPTYAP